MTDDIVKLIIDMHETMNEADGIGLAATQVGRLERVITVNLSEIEELKEIPPFTLINPEIAVANGSVVAPEGCLSIPEVRDEVERNETITVNFLDTNMEPCSLDAAGMIARVILHEIDHLDGILFLDHVDKEKKKMHKEQLKLISKGEVEVTYPVILEAPAAKVKA
jgi:peptide deformylase